MTRALLPALLLLAGCAGGPANEPGHRSEKTPAAAALAGEPRPEGGIAEANRRNAERLREGDWRAVKPAVGPESP
jgi:hypothetical protein